MTGSAVKDCVRGSKGQAVVPRAREGTHPRRQGEDRRIAKVSDNPQPDRLSLAQAVSREGEDQQGVRGELRTLIAKAECRTSHTATPATWARRGQIRDLTTFCLRHARARGNTHEHNV